MMKNAYVSPKLEQIVLLTDEVLTISGGNVILDESKNQSGTPAEEFGNISLW